MNPLDIFLTRLRNLTRPNEDIRKVVEEELLRMKIPVPFERINIRDGVLYVDTEGSRALKNEIFLRHEKILAMLKEKFGKRAPTSLR